ncbi:MAG: FixH family protein [Psychromonas sp.]
MKNNNKAWFKQFWPWFLIILPLTAVIAATNLLFTAMDNKPEMVVDEYYAKGKAINEDLTLIKNAKNNNISAVVTQNENDLIISVTGIPDQTAISFSLFHSTLAARDMTQMLTADGNGDYHFKTDNTLDGKWSLRIESFDKSWRLQEVAIFPTTSIKL